MKIITKITNIVLLFLFSYIYSLSINKNIYYDKILAMWGGSYGGEANSVEFDYFGIVDFWSINSQPLITATSEWYFIDSTDEWILSNNLTGSVENSIYSLTIIGSDPYMHSPDNLNLDTDEFKYIRIRMKNNTDDNLAQIYWITNEDSI